MSRGVGAGAPHLGVPRQAGETVPRGPLCGGRQGAPGQTLSHSVQAAREAGPAPLTGTCQQAREGAELGFAPAPRASFLTHNYVTTHCWLWRVGPGTSMRRLGPSESGPFHAPRKCRAQTRLCCQGLELRVPNLFRGIASM